MNKLYIAEVLNFRMKKLSKLLEVRFLFLIVSLLITSCGKKGDPVYNGKNKYKQMLSTQQSTLS